MALSPKIFHSKHIGSVDISSNGRPFSKGDKVVLVSDTYTTCESNPVLGTEYECTGEIVSVDPSGMSMVVFWDNEKRNTYKAKDLAIMGKRKPLNPNLIFKVHKREKFSGERS